MPSKMVGNKSVGCSSDSSSTRLQRNLAEKQRRYKLNSYISELANIVPMVSMSSKRLDKTSILRLSAAHLRIYQSSLNSSKSFLKSKHSYLDADNIWKILEAIDGFLLVTTESGKIIYISQSVEQFLGHQNIEMIGHSLLSFVHPADVESVQIQLEKLALEKKDMSSSRRHSFYCRIRERSQHRSEVVTYQLVHITGHMSSIPQEESEKNAENTCTGLPQVNFLFKAFVRLVQTQPYSELSLTDAIEDEYVTRHSLDGTIIFADHRLSTITGHLPHEVFGMSAYHYIISNDIPVALFAHKLMFTNINGAGLIVYRLRTKNQGKVYLKTTGYLQYDKSSLEIDHFMCVNKLLTDEEGEDELKKFIDRFTPHIGNCSVKTLYESLHTTRITGVNNSKIKCKLTTQTLILNSEKQTETSSLIKDEPPDHLVSASGVEVSLSSGDCSPYANMTTVYNNRTRHLSSACNEECKKLYNRATQLVCGMPSSSMLHCDASSNSSYCTNSESEEFQHSKGMEISDSTNSEYHSKSEDDSNSGSNHKLKIRNVSTKTDDLSKEPMEVCSPHSTASLIVSHTDRFHHESRKQYNGSEATCITAHTVNTLSTYRTVKKELSTEIDYPTLKNITPRQMRLHDSNLLKKEAVEFSSNDKHFINTQDHKRPSPDEEDDFSPHSSHSDIDCQNQAKKRIMSPSKISTSSVCSSHSS